MDTWTCTQTKHLNNSFAAPKPTLSGAVPRVAVKCICVAYIYVLILKFPQILYYHASQSLNRRIFFTCPLKSRYAFIELI